MVQASRPQADHISNFPLPSDPGPYSADQWAEYMRYFYTGDRQTTQGPLVDVDNCLAVTSNLSTTASVDTGAAIVNGHVFISTEQETWNVGAPAGQRTDIIALVENNTNAEIIAATAAPGRPFLFPVGAAAGEYTATPGVPAYSARLVIYQGTDGGAYVPPTLDTSTAKFAIEIGRYNIHNVGPTISSVLDTQEWAVTPTASVQRIEQKVLAAKVATVTFAGIPQCFSHLKIEMQTRTDRADAQLTDQINMRFNADGGANYDHVYLVGERNNTRTSGGTVNAAFIWIANTANANAPANYSDQCTININNYRRTTFFKTATAEGGQIEDHEVGAGLLGTWRRSGWWHDTSAITAIELYTVNADDFEIGCVFTLYGLT